MVFQAPRGTADILPGDQGHWRFFRHRAEEMAARFGYERIDTPVFEDARLFVRGVGEVTDIVEKETYTFEDRGGDLLTLRPEGTAPVCRAYLEHGMHNLPQPVRLYYMFPGFRYERPQSGRYRQHHQFGVELLGDADASADAEVIEVGWRFLESIGLSDLSLGVNSIGDAQCRPGYVEELKAYYRPHLDTLCTDCRRRLEDNPLRLLDCKRDSCQPVVVDAPRSIDYLCGECEGHWSSLTTFLGLLGLPYEVNHRLARGFDYYTRTVFEVTPPTDGQQNVLFGGGRYDGLIEELGGRSTPGVGFGMGAERVISNLRSQGDSRRRLLGAQGAGGPYRGGGQARGPGPGVEAADGGRLDHTGSRGQGTAKPAPLRPPTSPPATPSSWESGSWRRRRWCCATWPSASRRRSSTTLSCWYGASPQGIDPPCPAIPDSVDSHD